MGSTAGLSALQGVGTMAQAYSESESIRAQGAYQREMAELNASRAEDQSRDAYKRGEEEASVRRKRTKLAVGSQRAALAAQGISVDSGTALNIQQDTEALGALDEMTIRNNAIREAYGYRSQAADFRSQGDFASLSARANANATLLTGGMRAIGTAYDTSSKKKTKTDLSQPWWKR